MSTHIAGGMADNPRYFWMEMIQPLWHNHACQIIISCNAAGMRCDRRFISYKQSHRLFCYLKAFIMKQPKQEMLGFHQQHLCSWKQTWHSKIKQKQRRETKTSNHRDSVRSYKSTVSWIHRNFLKCWWALPRLVRGRYMSIFGFRWIT